MTFTKFLKLIKRDGTEHYSREQNNANLDIIDKAIEDISSLTAQAQGASFTLTDAPNNCGLYSLYVSGNSSQNGTPTPDAPIEIESIGDSGGLSVTACGKNLFDNSLLIRKTDDNKYTEMTADGRIHFVNSAGGYFRVAASVELPAGEYVFYRAIETISGLAYVGINDGSINTYNDKEFTLTEKGTVTVILTTSNQTTIGEYYCNIVIVKKGSSTDYEAYKSNTATITSALPLCSVGDVKDELIFNADGTAKVIKRNLKYAVDTDTTVASYTALGNYARCQIVRYYVPGLPASNVLCNIFLSKISYGEDIPHTFIDGTALYVYVPIAELSTQDNDGVKSWLIDKGAYFVYPLSAPQEISLTADETAALLSLETFEGLTNVFNSDNAEMVVKYWRNEAVGSLLTSISRSTNSRLTALENAIIGG